MKYSRKNYPIQTNGLRNENSYETLKDLPLRPTDLTNKSTAQVHSSLKETHDTHIRRKNLRASFQLSEVFPHSQKKSSSFENNRQILWV